MPLCIQLYTYGCVPSCVNGIIDMGVYEFQRDLIDAVIENAFIRDDSCSDMVAAWRRFGERMVHATEKLLASPAPPQPIFLESAGLEPIPDEGEDSADGADGTLEDDGSGGAQLPLSSSYPAVSTVADTAAYNSTPCTSAMTGDNPSVASASAASFDSKSCGTVSAAAVAILPLRTSATAPSESANNHAQPAVHPRDPPLTPASDPLAVPISNAATATSNSSTNLKGSSELMPPPVLKSPPPELAANSLNDKGLLTPPLASTTRPPKPATNSLNDEGLLKSIAAHDITTRDPSDSSKDVMNGKGSPNPPHSAAAPEIPSGNLNACSADPSDGRDSCISPTPAAVQETRPSNLNPSGADHSSPLGSPPSIKATSSKHAVTVAEASLGVNAAELFGSDDSLSDPEVRDSSAPSSPSKVPVAKGKGEVADRKASSRSGMESGKPAKAPNLRPLELGTLPRRPARNTGDNEVQKRPRSLSLESELPFMLGRSSSSRGRKPLAKKQRRNPHPKVPPLIAAFPVDPPVEGDTLSYPDLLEPSPALASGIDEAPGVNVDAPPLGVPMVMRLELLTPVYSVETDEVTLETRPFNFPYFAKVRSLAQMTCQCDLHMLCCTAERYGGASPRRRSGKTYNSDIGILVT